MHDTVQPIVSKAQKRMWCNQQAGKLLCLLGMLYTKRMSSSLWQQKYTGITIDSSNSSNNNHNNLNNLCHFQLMMS